MKKQTIFFLTALLAATALPVNVPTRYYVGTTEVSEAFWNRMPDTLNYITGEFDYDTLMVKERYLPFTHYIDSVSVPGEYVLCKRSPEAIADLQRRLDTINSRRDKSIFISEGTTAPQLRLIRYADGSVVDNLIVPGQCYLLSFWATWCGNCLLELSPEFIPAIAEQFSGNPDFHFIPICIDASSQELSKFFKHHQDSKLSYLSEITYIDADRTANRQFGADGIMPLNVVIGTDGTVRYIRSGVIKEEKSLNELSDAIRSGI